MTRFKYRAMDDQGNAFTDIMEADSARQATLKLKERGLTVSSVEPVDKPKSLLRSARRLTADELHLFVQQLQAITRSGLPLGPALKSLAGDLHSTRMKPALQKLYRDLEQGLALDEALDKQPDVFPHLFVDVVRAGQATNNLSGVLQVYLRHTERFMNFQSMMKTALAYPAMILLLTMIIMTFLLTKVVPVFAEIFTEFGGDLPAPTKFLLNLSNWIQWNWAQAIIASTLSISIVYLAKRWADRYEAFRIRLDWVGQHVPLLGRIRYLVALSRFSRTLSLLLESHLPLLPSLEMAAAASASPLLERAVLDANLRIANGDRIADALAGTGFFPYHYCWLIGTGEDRGEVEVALENAAETMERELTARDKLIITMFGPVLVVLVALLIGWIVVALYLPIFTLGDSISGT